MVYGSGVKIMSDSTPCNRLKELTIVDFERDSAETESKHSSLHSLLTQVPGGQVSDISIN